MVWGLKSYVKNVPNVQETISIEHKIEEWKCANHGALPIIVIDFPGFYRTMCDNKQSQLDLLFGNHENSLNLTKLVLDRFKRMGVKLAFFYGGSSKFVKNPECINKRQHARQSTINALLDTIKKENSPKDILQQVNRPIYNNSSYFVAAIMLAQNYGSLHKSYYNECERDIALYATRHNAIAIISNDYEFVLVNSEYRRSNGIKAKWNLWDVGDFNLKTFQILQIDQTKFQNALALTDDQLQIFGVLTGNNFQDSLVPQFIHKLGDFKYRFQNVAKYIKKKFCEADLALPVKIASTLSPRDIDKNAQIAEETLKFFANRIDSKPVCEDKNSIIAKDIHNSYVYEYLNDLHVAVQSLCWHKTTYPAFMGFALIIHRRQMGVVLQHRGKKPGRCLKVICIDPKGITIINVQPIYPLLKVPPLSRLYEISAEELVETKLKLLCWIVSEQLNNKTIENIPKQYLSAVLALVYLVEILFISNVQADFILYCLQEYQTKSQSMNTLPYPDTISEIPFQLIFLYDKFHQFMVMSMNTVGLSDWVMHNQLHGIYFHTNYDQFMNLPVGKRDDLLIQVNDYRLYLNK